MRLRNKPWASERISDHPQYVVAEPQEIKGQWNKEFGNDNPIHIEVGTGKGQFVTEMARANPDVNYIGIELYESVIVTALDRLIEAGLPNVKLLNVEAKKMTEYIE